MKAPSICLLVLPLLSLSVQAGEAEFPPGSPIVVLNWKTDTPHAKGGSVAFLEPDGYRVMGTVDVGIYPE